MVIVIILTKGIHFVHKPRGLKFMTPPPPFPLCLFVSNSSNFYDPPPPPIGDRAVFASSLRLYRYRREIELVRYIVQ